MKTKINKPYVYKAIPTHFTSEVNEIAMIAAIIAAAHHEAVSEWVSGIEASGKIGECAVAFYSQFRQVQWPEEKDGVELKTMGFTDDIVDWDEAVEQWSGNWLRLQVRGF